MSRSPFHVEVLSIVPHPDQATTNPCCWAVRFSAHLVSKVGSDVKYFWRWYAGPSTTKKPSAEQALKAFWLELFADDVNGFDFETLVEYPQITGVKAE